MTDTGMRRRVVVLEDDEPVRGIDEVEAHAEVRVVKAESLRDAVQDAHALLMWDFFSEAVHGAFQNGVPETLEWIHVAASGVDALLTPRVVASPVRVTRAVGVFERPIAEYVLACVAAHAKELWATRAHQERRRWEQRRTTMLFGRRAVIVGAGGIGSLTAKLLRAVGIDVTLVGREDRTTGSGETVLGLSRLVQVVPGADYLVLALPLTKDTEHLIDERVLRLLPPDAYVVNVGRGRTLDQDALGRLVADGAIAGAAIDAFETEPLPASDPLWRDPHVFVSPHMSSRADSWREALADQFLDQFRLWVGGVPFTAQVDKDRGY